MANKAWKVEVAGFGEPGVVAAETRGRAAYITFLSLDEAGYDRGFKDIRVTRWAEYDRWAVSERAGCFTLEYATSQKESNGDDALQTRASAVRRESRAGT